VKITEKQKQMAALLLLPVAGYMVYTNVLSGDSSPTPPPPSALVVRVPQKLQAVDLAQKSATAVAGGGPKAAPIRRTNTSQEWTPRVGGRRPEDRADPAKTDPTLRLELLARLQGVAPAAAGRSLFDFTTAPVAPLPKDEKVNLKQSSKGGEPPKVATPPPPPSGPPPEPPPPAIPLKFYGFVQGEGGKRAFFRVGEEDIFVASEGLMLQGRYKIVRIGLSSAMVEDTQYKNNQQSLRIEEIPRENI